MLHPYLSETIYFDPLRSFTIATIFRASARGFVPFKEGATLNNIQTFYNSDLSNLRALSSIFSDQLSTLLKQS